jgi:hypothetical protein
VSAVGGGLLRGWRWHLACCVLLIAELGMAVLWHRSTEELVHAWETGTVLERIAALGVLATGGRGAEIDSAFVAGLLREPDERLRAMAMTASITRHSATAVQADYLNALVYQDFEQWWRLYIVLRAKVGGAQLLAGQRLRRQELRWFVDSFWERLSPAAVMRHLGERRDENVDPLDPHLLEDSARLRPGTPDRGHALAWSRVAARRGSR